MNKKTVEKKSKLWSLSLAALGVVYGDIGTSPLYAIKISLQHLPINSANILGVLSLIFWILIIVISGRYLLLFLKANHEGEGGVLALLALLEKKKSKAYRGLFLMAVLGAGLLLGDGMITPAISVVSAVEGLQVISPNFSHFILPITFIILLSLFFFQRFGTGRIGQYFGPVILLWFITIGLLGAISIYHNPAVIDAINPYYAVNFFYQNTWQGYLILGGIFLVITGAEAMYADLGHFGLKPIRYGWYVVALPALVLNYFGQGANLLQNPAAIANPFYLLSPVWFYYLLLALATMTCVIASQAVISASFSLAKQAMLLDLCPRLSIIQTSEIEHGQIYVPQINFILATGTLLLIIILGNSTNLAGAYGIAVNMVMIVVSFLVLYVARYQWHWSIIKIAAIFPLFMLMDFAFLGANLFKIKQGGWIPLVFAFVSMIIMLTWHKGIQRLRSSHYMNKVDLKSIIHEFDLANLKYVHDTTAIFITDPYDQSGGNFLHYLKLNRVLPQRVLIVCVNVEKRPYVTRENRFFLKKLTHHIYRLELNYGFSQIIDVTETLQLAAELDILPFSLEIKNTPFFIESINIKVTKKSDPQLLLWQKKLFSLLMRNSALEIDFLQLPYTRTITIGTYYKI